MNVSRQSRSGFTLIEMLVSIGLFSVVITIAVGTLLVLIDTNARAQALQLVMTNFSFAIDSVSREVRTGINFYCTSYAGVGSPALIPGSATNDCANGGNVLSVVEIDNDTTGPSAVTTSDRRITFWFNVNYYGVGHGALLRRIGQTSDWIPMTGDDIDVDTFEVIVTGTTRGDFDQPRVTMYIAGAAGSVSGEFGENLREFSLQTTVTQRQLDL